MTYFVMPNWLYYIFVSAVIFGFFMLILFVGVGIYLDVKEKKEKKKLEKELLGFTEEGYNEDELCRIEALFPGKYSAEYLYDLEACLLSMLDGVSSTQSDFIDLLYDLSEKELTDEQADCADARIDIERQCENFISFMQDHGIDAYFHYLQTGEACFDPIPGRMLPDEVREDKPNE